MQEEIIYFELNNWMPNSCYPDAEPFITWVSYKHFNFDNEEWIKDNKLVVVRTVVDMSANWCITATKEWVLKNCPELLTKYTKFLRYPDEDGEPPYGEISYTPFYEYTEENIGWHFIDEENY